ncbi:MAG: hypothetical protein HGA85_09150 [Nanoarchaeota archaeon]|nr:hypothetical protein [Nanoarchaeota archaeon]
MNDISEKREEGMNIVWMLNSQIPSEPPRRFQKSKAMSLQKKLDSLWSNLRGKTEEDFYLVSASNYPLLVILPSLYTSSLELVFSKISPSLLRLGGEIYRKSEPISEDSFGCINNVAGLCHRKNYPWELGVVLDRYV